MLAMGEKKWDGQKMKITSHWHRNYGIGRRGRLWKRGTWPLKGGKLLRMNICKSRRGKKIFEKSDSRVEKLAALQGKAE